MINNDIHNTYGVNTADQTGIASAQKFYSAVMNSLNENIRHGGARAFKALMMNGKRDLISSATQSICAGDHATGDVILQILEASFREAGQFVAKQSSALTSIRLQDLLSHELRDIWTTRTHSAKVRGYEVAYVDTKEMRDLLVNSSKPKVERKVVANAGREITRGQLSLFESIETRAPEQFSSNAHHPYRDEANELPSKQPRQLNLL